MKISKIVALSFVCGIFFFCASNGPSYSQTDYPSKNITILVPYEPGGISDSISRLISDVGRKYSPQPFVVVNRPGASGTTAIFELVQSKPDGYTIAFASSSEASSALHILPAKYTIDSYTVVCQAGNLPVVIATKGPWTNLKEFVEYAQKNPDKIRAGVPGLGTVVRLTGERFVNSAGLKLKIVPFQGSGPLLPAVLGGHVEVAFMNVPEISPQYKAGELKVLCVFGDERSKSLPGAPTAKEQNFDISGGASHFILFPNGVPPAVRDKMDSIMKKVIEDPDFQKRTSELGYTAFYRNAEGAKAFIRDWYALSEKLYSSLGMKKR
jgi:tripartite-type tricarboxylate transporter receptor subunit TctC